MALYSALDGDDVEAKVRQARSSSSQVVAVGERRPGRAAFREGRAGGAWPLARRALRLLAHPAVDAADPRQPGDLERRLGHGWLLAI